MKIVGGLIFGLFVVAAFAHGFGDTTEIEFAGRFGYLLDITLLAMLGFWIQSDSRTNSFAGMQDWGWFLILAWPILLPYYLIKTRKSKGLLLVLFALIIITASYWTGGSAAEWIEFNLDLP